MVKGLSFLLLAALIISPAFVSKTAAQSGDGRQVVSWMNLVNCTAAGSALEKIAGRDDTADAGARSEQTINGDGFVEFTATSAARTVFCGFSRTALGTDYVGIDFSIKLTDYAVAEVRENNIYGGETTYRAGDVFRVSTEGNVVRYFKNGLLFYTGQRTPTYPLIVQATFMHVGGRIENVTVGTASETPPAEWRMYQHDPGHSGYSSFSRVNTGNVSQLTPAWSFKTGSWVTGTPVVADGTVYVGSWDGKMYALRESDGSLVWSFTAGTLAVGNFCGGPDFGIDGTAAVVNGRLYFGSASCAMYSLDAATGQQIWRAQLADPLEGYHLWTSPLVFDGKIYVGLASHCGAVCLRGRMFCLDAATGQVVWSLYTAPEGSGGAGVWSSFAIDAGRRAVYVATGNYCGGNDIYGDSILGINADTGVVLWQYKNAARNRDQRNFDFGASPVLFDTAGIPALAVGSKDGNVYAVRRENGELLWSTTVVEGGGGSGIISSPAAAYGLVFTGAHENSSGKLVALDQFNGRIVWEAALPAQTNGAASVSGGVVFIGASDGFLRAFDALTGTPLWSVRRGAILGGVSISQNHVFTGSVDGSVYAFALSSATPTPTQPQKAINVNTPVTGDEWLKGSKYEVRWSLIGSISRVDVSISRDGGATWKVLAEGVDASLGSVRVKAKKPRSDTVIVQVSDSSDSTVRARSGSFRIR